MKTPTKKRKAPALVETHYEIEELIKPNDTLGNDPYWTPCCVRVGRSWRRYRETDLSAAKAQFKKAEPGTRKLRLVQVDVIVLAEREPTK